MYTRRLSFVSLALVVLCLSAFAVKADEVVLWNFNDDNLVVDRGVGTLTTTANPVNVVFFSGTTVLAQMGDPAGNALAIQGGAGLANNGSILELRASTVGFNFFYISWAWQATTTGFNSIQLQFSADGTTFTNFFSPFDPPDSFAAPSARMVIPLSEEAWNNPNFAFRWILNGATNAAGNVRFDNIVLHATPAIPEPATMLLLATGLAGVAAKVARRRRARKE
jgi:hypothetical protein